MSSIDDDASQLLLMPGLCSLQCQKQVRHVPPQSSHLLLQHQGHHHYSVDESVSDNDNGHDKSNQKSKNAGLMVLFRVSVSCLFTLIPPAALSSAPLFAFSLLPTCTNPCDTSSAFNKVSVV